MESFSGHIKENAIAYGVVAVCLIPLLYIFRRYTKPFVFHTLEVVIYMSVFHVIFHYFVHFAAWFRESSAFDPVEVPWDTPLNQNFWDQQFYTPRWLFWVEVAFLVLFVFIAVYFRPMKLGDSNRYGGKEGMPGSKHAAKHGRVPRRQPFTRQSGRRR